MKLKLIDTDNRWWLPKGRGQWGWVKGAQYIVTNDDHTWVVGTQCNIHMRYHRKVYLKPMKTY